MQKSDRFLFLASADAHPCRKLLINHSGHIDIVSERRKTGGGGRFDDKSGKMHKIGTILWHEM